MHVIKTVWPLYIRTAMVMLCLVAALFLTGELTVPYYLSTGYTVLFLIILGGGIWLIASMIAWTVITLVGALRTALRS